jgi:hypothetical protein
MKILFSEEKNKMRKTKKMEVHAEAQLEKENDVIDLICGALMNVEIKSSLQGRKIENTKSNSSIIIKKYKRKMKS